MKHGAKNVVVSQSADDIITSIKALVSERDV